MTADGIRLVEVSFFTSLRKPLTYRAPADLGEEELLGRRAIVPVGHRKMVGVITGLDASYGGETKQIDSFPDVYPVLSASDLELCRFVASYYFASLGEVIKAFLPQPLTARLNQRVMILLPERLRELAAAGDKTAMILVEQGGTRGVIAAHRIDPVKGSGLNHLREEGIIDFDWEVRRDRRSDSDYVARLAPDTAIPKKLGGRGKAVLDYLGERGEVSLPALRKETGASAAQVNALVRRGLLQLLEKPPFVDLPPPAMFPRIRLNEDQSHAVDEITTAIGQSVYAPFLLYGVTGSGKTEVYIAAIRAAVTCGKSVIVVVPEIGLSQAIYYRLERIFGSQLGLLHSRMTARSRLEVWRKAKWGKLKIVLGPRSAVFSPLPDLGLIVVDEEHDQSLKQSSPAPRYHARDVAVYRAQQERCAVVLGSATPSVESYYNASTGKYRLLELPHRVEERAMPRVATIDLRESFKRKGSGYLSEILSEQIKTTLSARGQVMLLLNRRGFAPSIHCFDCAAKLECKRCAVSLVYHKALHRVVCHLCGYQEPYPDTCPHCGSNLFLYKGMGTEKLEEELRRSFPEATVIRMDLDSTRRRGSFQELYHRFKSGRAQILVGTQMISKGFDFPDVALVGIVSADTALELPDFRARERTFQLMTQASGRAGRLSFPGEVLLQTLHPEDRIVALAAAHDFKGFYEHEIKERRELIFPPFAHLILLEVQSLRQESAETAASELRKRLMKFHGRIYTVLGPIAAPILKRRNLFRFHLLLKTKKVKMTLAYLGELLAEKGFRQTAKLNVIVDVDAVDMM